MWLEPLPDDERLARVAQVGDEQVQLARVLGQRGEVVVPKEDAQLALRQLGMQALKAVVAEL